MEPVILVHGPSGSGKGTQCELLAKELGGIHISTGDLLRQHTKTFNDIAGGRLAESADIIRLLKEALESVSAKKAIILDGVARMPEEAKWLYEELQRIGRPVDLVIILTIPEVETMNRLLGRAGDQNRPDDTEAGIKKRLDWYHMIVSETLEFWRTKTKVLEVDGVGTVDEVFARMQEVVHAA